MSTPAVTPNPGLQVKPLDIISSAMRLVGALASGETPSNAEAQDALSVANQMLDAWSAERTSVFTVPRVTADANGNTLSLVSGQQTYKLGNANGGEDFYMPRPARIERISVLYSASQSTPVEVPLEVLTDVGWQGVANKTTTSTLPQAVFNDLGFPDISLSFWPIPTQANPIALYPWTLLTSFQNLTTLYTFPPGYMEAIRYNLALRLQAEFPQSDMSRVQLVMKLANDSKARIASLNAPVKEASCDPALLNFGAAGNIYTGSPNRSHGY